MRVKRLLRVLDPSLIVQAVSVTSPLPFEVQTWGYPAGLECNCMVRGFDSTRRPDDNSAKGARGAGRSGPTPGMYATSGPVRGRCGELTGVCKAPGGHHGSQGCKNPVFKGSKVDRFRYDCSGYSMPSRDSDPTVATRLRDGKDGVGCAGICDTIVGSEGADEEGIATALSRMNAGDRRSIADMLGGRCDGTLF